jgi:RNA polymerase sigma factor (sigma-70 family)
VAGRSPCEGSPSLSHIAPGHHGEPGPSLGLQRRGEAGLPRESCVDRETMRRLHAVDTETYPDWETIYLDNVQRLYRLMYSRVGNRPDAEDLTSEVFMAALEPLRTSASKPEVRAYLIATARTVLAGYWRRKLGMEVTAIDVDAAVEFIDDRPRPASDPDDRAGRVLGRLPERYRRILELRFLQSKSLKEVATEMRITVGNAKVLQHRALRRAAEAGKDVVP